MNERDQFWKEWLAEREAVSARIETAVQDILLEGYSTAAVVIEAPYREHVQRAYRDRVTDCPHASFLVHQNYFGNLWDEN